MARLACVVIRGLPHRVTQRGNDRPPTFFSVANYALDRDLLAAKCRAAAVECGPDAEPVHLILVPSDPGPAACLV